MADTFTLPVEFNGKEREYPAQIFRYGFTHKIQVTIDDEPVTFEPDEEGSYRASVAPESNTDIDRGLLEAISKTLIFLFND